MEGEGKPLSKTLRPALGFDEVALVPGTVTINPDEVDLSWHLEPYTLAIPFLASAMDAVVDPHFAITFGKMGGLAVLNLEGLQTRYQDPTEAFRRIMEAKPEKATEVLQDVYKQPIQPGLVGKRIEEIKRAGVVTVASTTPAMASTLGAIAREAGLDIFVVQSTVTTTRHISKSYHQLDFRELHRELSIPIIVGNCASYEAAYELMETGIDGLLVGVGPGAACTSREVLGIGVPQVTATMDCAAAREAYYRTTGRYVPIVTDGGMRTGGDICKALASGADALMLGSIFAATWEAPGFRYSEDPSHGYNWGMATPHPALPRGTRIKVPVTAGLKEVLLGPAHRSDGTQNLVGAIRICMGLCSARDIREMHKVEMVIAPSIKTEGKIWQLAGSY